RPHNMLASSTHDAKRSEDVRARVNVIAEMPAAWKLTLKRWSRLNRSKKRRVDEVEAPSRNDEYLLYQTLLGAWPLRLDEGTGFEANLEEFRERIDGFMIKALREAKEHSSWANVNADYEAAMSGFVQGVLAPGEKNLFLADIVAMLPPIVHFGLLNSLAQTLIKLTSPGVPDIYQGCDSWQFNLVDPDNRRPIDFDRRRRQLAEVREMVAGEPAQWREHLQALLDDLRDGRIKLYTTWQTLALRSRWPEVFRDGDYLPLSVVGEKAVHVCAYARSAGGRTLIAVVPRLPVRLLGNRAIAPVGAEVWGDTALELPAENGFAASPWFDALSGASHAPGDKLALADVLAWFPLALLTTESAG
ncbi:MAG: 4-alpha-glucanotransferase, partial [Propionivibrio sp.]